jgi:hypothetical protein
MKYGTLSMYVENTEMRKKYDINSKYTRWIHQFILHARPNA